MAVVVVGTLAACESVSDRAGELADEAVNRANTELEQAVQEQVDAAIDRFGGNLDVGRICELVADGRLTGTERARLEVAVEVGDALGLPATVTDAARQVLDASDGATDQVDALSQACREAGATTSGT